MVLSDFEFGGYVTLSRFFHIETVEQASVLDGFLQQEELVQESFQIAGPGLYYILVDRGWDRCGDTLAFIVKKVPETSIAPAEFLNHLTELSAHFDSVGEPLALARSISTQGQYRDLTPEQKAMLTNFDYVAYESAKAGLTNLLEGLDQ